MNPEMIKFIASRPILTTTEITHPVILVSTAATAWLVARLFSSTFKVSKLCAYVVNLLDMVAHRPTTAVALIHLPSFSHSQSFS